MNGKKIIAMTYVLLINRIEIAFTKRKVVNSIEQIGFTGAIVSDKTIYLFRKKQTCRVVVLKISKF